ncbi:MAG: O-antigen ligase family protein [Candidatus Omnitrophica bacterium]|nr:O-antigen ligase family protein [Candidatus Omnitrophota bacterium]
MEIKDKFVCICDRVLAFSFYVMVFFLSTAPAIIESFFAVMMFGYVFKRSRLSYLQGRRDTKSGQIKVAEKLKRFFTAYKPIDNALNVPIAIFVLLSILSIVFNPYWGLGWKGFFCKLWESLFIYFIFIETMRTRDRQMKFLLVSLFSLFFTLVNGVYQYITREGFMLHTPITDGRVTSAFSHSNDFGAYLVTYIPLLLCLSLRLRLSPAKHNQPHSAIERFIDGMPFRVLSFFVFIVAVIILGLTYSRSAWIAFFVAFLFIGASRPKILLIVFLMIVIFLSVFIPRMLIERQSNFAGRRFIDAFTSSSRLIYWDEAIRIVRDYPLLGVGLNAYSKVGPAYKTNLHGSGGYPHNCYLQTAAEIGILGCLVFLWMMWRLIKSSIRFIRNSNHLTDANLQLGIIAGLIGLWVHSFFDTSFYNIKLNSLMWLMMGFAIAVQKLHTEAHNVESQ